jgi:predicted ATPase/class 3 adenylate cyclase
VRLDEAARADRRTVTVLFADLSGFTAISELLDPEIVQSLQNEIFEEMTAATESFGGFVDKFIGDAMLALFGAPAAHEDDPERALRAALDMIDRVAHASERSRAVRSPLKLHVGVNTGPVVAGGIGAGSARSYSVTGDTVNTAQRLQSMAAPGEVLVGASTCALTRHAFRFESLGEASVRGRAGGVVVHRLVGPLETPRPARGLESLGLSAALVGRSAELARMVGHLELAAGGVAQLLRLVGEAGIGKTRLVNEFLASIGRDERFAAVAVRRVACSPLGEQSYGALGALLRAAYGIDFNASAAETGSRLTKALAELGLSAEETQGLTPFYLYVLGLGDPNSALQHVEPVQLRRQIFFAVRTLFERRVALSPLLIVIEDLHWADAVSLEALRFLLDRLDKARLMVVVTHRPMAELDLFGSSRVSQTALRLTALDEAQCRTLLASYFGEECVRASNDLCRRIFERSSGNPLFIEEILRSLIEIGVLRREGTYWRVVAAEASIDIPAGIHALLTARMDRLPPEARALVQEAAVIGPRFEVVLLKAIATNPAAVDAGLDVLTDAEVVEEMGSAKPISQRAYRFRQSLLHDAIYQNLLVQRRAEMHGLIGMALERLCGPNPERLEDAAMLGHHFSLSAMKLKGAQYLRAAGDRASAIYANDDAVRLYRQALTVLAASGDQAGEQQRLRERIADLCGRSGRRDEAREMYQTALEAHRADGARGAAARILRKLGSLAWDGGKRNQAEGHYAEAASLLEGTNAPIEEAHLMQERGRIAFRLGDHVAAAKWADKALDRVQSAPQGGDEAARSEAARAAAEALNTKGVALARLGRSQDALREVERSVAGAEAAGLLGAACRGYTNLGVLYTVIDPSRAIEVCQRGLETARRIGDLGFQARLLANLAVASCTFTDRCGDEGVPAAEKAIELDRALDQREHLPVPLIALGHIFQCHGRPELAGRYYSEALEVAHETDDPQHLFPCYDGLATLSLDRGDMDEAERYFTLAQEVCARHGLNPESLVVLPFLD